MDVVMTVRLMHPVSGREIMETVQLVAGNGYQQKLLQESEVDEWVGGYCSPYPDLDVAVFAFMGEDGAVPIRLHEEYMQVIVTNYEWPALHYATGSHEDRVEEAVSDFRDRLEEELMK